MDVRFARPVLAALFLAFGLSPAFAAPMTYEDHKIVVVDVANEQEEALLESLKLDIWSCSGHVHIGEIQVRVSPEQLAVLERVGLRHRVKNENIAGLINAQREVQRGATFHQSYHTLAEIEGELQQMVLAHPAIAQIQNFGTSLQNRPMQGLRITGPGDASARPAIFFHGGQHAREWIGPAVMMYIADWLLTNYGSNAVATQLINEIEWFILPVMNPDGYEYTWTNERLWRKNRRLNADNSIGVDLNRNWGYEWGGEGASTIPSDLTYRGPSPFSEPETQAIRDFILARPNIVAYVDFHSFSELILWPWGYTSNLSADQVEFAYLGQGMHDRLQVVHGHSYTYGPTYTTIYPASGVSSDWVYGANLPDRFIAAFAFELRDTGQSGFLLPPDQIIPTGEENLQAVLFLAEAASEKLRVQLVSTVPASLSPNDTLTITAEVIPRAHDLAPSGVSLRYRLGAGAFDTVTMPAIGGDLYEVQLSGLECGEPVEFYVQALSDLGVTVTEPGAAPAESFSVPVGITFVHSFDNFEVPSGWSVGAAGDSATTGVWIRVDPVGTLAQPEQDYSPPPGTQCFVTGQGSVGGSIGANDVDGGGTTLLSPVFDLPVDSFTITYALSYYSTDVNDVLAVSASNNGGASWTPVETLNVGSSAWALHSFRPADIGLAATSQMRLRFVAADNSPASIVEAAVDEFLTARFGCANGDYNDDGQVNLADSARIGECMNGPTAASVSAACGVFNFNFDTDVDMDDYLAFVLRFGQ